MKQKAIQLLSDWMHLIGIDEVVKIITPGKSRHIGYMIKKKIAPPNGEGQIVRRKMRMAGKVLTCLLHPTSKKNEKFMSKHDIIKNRCCNLQKVLTEESAELVIEILTKR